MTVANRPETNFFNDQNKNDMIDTDIMACLLAVARLAGNHKNRLNCVESSKH